jgi:CDP-diacylglycerol--glycerol-3-phosphate 3-phosphatidyltransferase
VDGVDDSPVVTASSGSAVTATDAGEDPGLDRILTVPNAVTVVRLACIPLYVWLLFGADNQVAAAGLLAGLGATDWIDGYIARRFHQVSTFGKVLDPVADRLLVVTAVITIMIHGAVPVWFGVATLAREVVVSGAVLLLASLGAARMDVIGVVGLILAWVAAASYVPVARKALADGRHADARTPSDPGNDVHETKVTR